MYSGVDALTHKPSCRISFGEGEGLSQLYKTNFHLVTCYLNGKCFRAEVDRLQEEVKNWQNQLSAKDIETSSTTAQLHKVTADLQASQ